MYSTRSACRREYNCIKSSSRNTWGKEPVEKIKSKWNDNIKMLIKHQNARIKDDMDTLRSTYTTQQNWIQFSGRITWRAELVERPRSRLVGKKKKGKATPLKGRERPQGCETSRFPHFLDIRLTNCREVVILTCWPHLCPREDSWYSFLLEAESNPGP
jgi:hypothetical protein